MEKDVVRDAKNKAARFCAYQERAPKQVKEKLGAYGLPEDQVVKVMEELVNEGFINEGRFARSYANGKFRLKKWGKLKIKLGLERLELDPICIESVLRDIPTGEYKQILTQLIEQKWNAVKAQDSYIRKHKVAQFAMSRGFEPDLIWNLLKELSLTSDN